MSVVVRWFRRACYVVVPLIAVYGATVVYVYTGMDGTAVFPVECGIVFGTAVWPVYNTAGEVATSVAGPGIKRRVSAAAELLKQGNIRRIFVTGGKGEGNRKSEGQVMREYAISIGVPKDVIAVEDRARSTWENLENTRPLTGGCTSVVAISDAYHLARIRLQARLQGWDLQTYPAQDPESLLFTARNLLREAAGIDSLVLPSLSR
ncbi:YdcF family protein [Candidatus Peribacteria bacterium]|nr:YdcF family protein [Candidatus Peribacteria bacterium]